MPARKPATPKSRKGKKLSRYERISPELKKRIRFDFENTEASIRSLAAHYGLSTDTVIRKWRDAEGWKKDVARIQARLVTQAMALGTDPLQPITLTIDSTGVGILDPKDAVPVTPPWETVSLPDDLAGDLTAHTADLDDTGLAEVSDDDEQDRTDDAEDDEDTDSQAHQEDAGQGATHPDSITPASRPVSPPASVATSSPPVLVMVDGVPHLEGKPWPWGYGVLVPPKQFTAGPDPATPDLKGPPRPKAGAAARHAAKKATALVPEVPECASRTFGKSPGSAADSADSRAAGSAPGGAGSSAPLDSKGAHAGKVRSGAAPHSRVALPLDTRDLEAEMDTRIASGMAAIQAAALKRHMALSDRMMNFGHQLLQMVTMAITPLPPDATDDDIRFQQTVIQRLTAINGEKDSLNTLAKTAATIIQSGILLQRKSIGMDGAAPSGLPPPAPEPRGTSVSIATLSHMPLDLLTSLREHMLAKSRERLPGTVATAIAHRAAVEPTLPDVSMPPASLAPEPPTAEE